MEICLSLHVKLEEFSFVLYFGIFVMLVYYILICAVD